MPRPPRHDYPDARHHVWNRGARKAPIFFDDQSGGLFVELLSELPERYGVRVHGYALLPNHFHLLLQTPNANLGRAMQFLCGTYALRMDRIYEWDGPMFKGRYRNRVVEDEGDWRDLLAYVHLNPVKAGLVRTPDAADWTSHGAYAGLIDPIPPWLTRDEITDLYGSLAAYREHLDHLRIGRGTLPATLDDPRDWEAWRRPKPEPASQADRRRPTGTIDDAIGEVADVIGLPVDEVLRAPRGRRGNRARWVAIWWLRRGDRFSGTRIARHLGVHPPAVSQMRSLVEAVRGTDEQIDDWMTRLEEG